jgi:hypothetical protein
MLTFGEARLAAVNHVAHWYPLEDAAYAAAREGRADERHWHVRVGDLRYIVLGGARYRGSEFPDVLVDRHNGEVIITRPRRSEDGAA